MSPEDRTGLITVEGILLFFFRRWKMFTIVFLAGCVAGLLLHVLLPKRYVAQGTYSLMSIATDSQGLDLRGASFLGVRTGASEEVKEIWAYLDSRKILRDLIERLDLLPALYPDFYDTGNSSWKGEPPPVDGGVSRLKDHIRTKLDEVLGLVWVDFQWDTPAGSKMLLDEYIKQINEAARRNAIAQYEATGAGLDAEMQTTNVTEVLTSLAQARAVVLQKLAFAKTSPEYLLRSIDPPTIPVAPKRFPIWFNTIIGGLVAVLIAAYGIATVAFFRNTIRPKLRTGE